MDMLWNAFRSVLRNFSETGFCSWALDIASFVSILTEPFVRDWTYLRIGYKEPEKIEKVVIWIRHPHTNEEIDRVYRAEDAEITPKGWEQAYMVAERIRELSDAQIEPVTHIVTSTLTRSRQLADVIALEIAKTRPLPVIIPSDLFVEVRKPSSFKFVHRDDPEVVRIGARMRRLFDWEYRYSDEENRWRLQLRVREALRLLASLDAKFVVVVTHGKFKRVVWHYIWEHSLRGFYRKADRLMRLGHTGIMITELKPAYRKETRQRADAAAGKNVAKKLPLQWTFVTWNDLAHTERTFQRETLYKLANMKDPYEPRQ